jgi:hypothetical protein
MSWLLKFLEKLTYGFLLAALVLTGILFVGLHIR